MADWSAVYSDLLSSYVEQYTDAQGNPDLRAQILADVKSQILQQASSGSVELPQNLRVAIRRVFLQELDPEDRDDEEHTIESILAATDKRKEQPGTGEDEDAREERIRPTKAGNYRKPFTDFTASQQLFKEDMDAYDRERRDTKDPKTIGQRTKIIQQWWESLADDKKAEAGRAASKWNKLGAPKETHELYRRKNFPSMARDFIETVRQTMGSNIVMFLAHETTDSQIKMAVFETQPPDGKKAFSESSEPTKDWVLNGEQMLTNYLLTEAAEEDLNDENHQVEIALDDEGNPEVPAWTGQNLKVQQSLARMVFQAAYAKFTGKPKAKVPWGLLIKSSLEYLSSNSIPEGFMMKDPSKWTKANMQMLWNHWNSQEEEDKGYFTQDTYHFSQLPFNFATEESRAAYDTAASKLASGLTTFAKVVIFLTTHTDEDRGDLFSGMENKVPVATEVFEFLQGLLLPFSNIVKCGDLIFFVCGSTLRKEESFQGLKEAVQQ
ncbi:hypothetical protein F5J12DRAFT_892403 [Pisolithus orientalis]|uniref:uncharacterized protein n=1 Tax=Pisolithus orientalis TaxID=936130 RepID=UPI00222477D4|nr:uncharacterized protein F5J12DRAFT_892403 [Pisolithus orientalis]KAI6007522.1 hypothetical protein F5J12DRAFT_892403 [Pisolithus orientalis]